MYLHLHKACAKYLGSSIAFISRRWPHHGVAVRAIWFYDNSYHHCDRQFYATNNNNSTNESTTPGNQQATFVRKIVTQTHSDRFAFYECPTMGTEKKNTHIIYDNDGSCCRRCLWSHRVKQRQMKRWCHSHLNAMQQQQTERHYGIDGGTARYSLDLADCWCSSVSHMWFCQMLTLSTQHKCCQIPRVALFCCVNTNLLLVRNLILTLKIIGIRNSARKLA